MRIVVAVNNGQVSQHFGHCESFDVYDIEGSKVANKTVLANPGHRPGFLPVYLKDNGANLVIAGGMGGSAKEIFNNNGIQVVTGANGSSEQVINDYLNNNLDLSDAECNHDHEHEDGHDCNH